MDEKGYHHIIDDENEEEITIIRRYISK